MPSKFFVGTAKEGANTIFLLVEVKELGLQGFLGLCVSTVTRLHILSFDATGLFGEVLRQFVLLTSCPLDAVYLRGRNTKGVYQKRTYAKFTGVDGNVSVRHGVTLSPKAVRLDSCP